MESEPLPEAITIAGSGHVDLWLLPGTEDTAVQATLTELRADGFEQRVQCGWHRPVHREEDPAHSDDLRVDYTFVPEHRVPLVPGEWVRFRLPIYPFAHVFRAGSRLRLTLSTPGRDHPFWCFDNPVEAGAVHGIGWGGDHPSALVLPVVDVVPVVLVVAVEAVLESDAASTVVAEARPKPRPAAASTPAAAVTTVVRFTRWSRSSRPWGVQLLVISSSCGSSSVI